MYILHQQCVGCLLSQPYNTKRDFYTAVYTIWYRIYLTIWTICAFRLLNPRQWSLPKPSSKNGWILTPQKCLSTSWSQKGWCNKLTEIQFQSILNTDNFDEFITYEYCKNSKKYLHWSICKTIQMLYNVKAATCRYMYITSTMFRLSGISLITYDYCYKHIYIDQYAKQYRCYITVRLQRQYACAPYWSYACAQVHTFFRS